MPRESTRHGVALSIAAILVAGGLVYFNSLSGPFIFDDTNAVQRNESIRRLSNIRQVLVPPRETPVAGRPIPNASLALNYAFGELDVEGYHVWNIAVHLAAALALFGIVRRTLLGSRLGGFTPGAANGVALAAALLWEIHPLQTEAVNYITQRTESMMGLFLFLTLYCAIRARHSVHAVRWAAASVTACALGMACKESMAAAPILVVLYDRVFEFDSAIDAVRARWRLYAPLAATWVELAALIWMTPRSTVGVSAGTSVWIYFLNQLQMIGTYLRLTVWPAALVADYGPPRTLGLGDVAPEAVVVALVLIAVAVALVRWPKVGFLGAAFVLTLAPTTSVVPIATEVGAERRMYVPLAALAVLLVLAARWVVGRVSARWRIRPVVVGSVMAAVVFVPLAARTIYRNQDYASPVVLWQSSVDRRPHGRARSLLASALLEVGRQDAAMIQLREAVHDYPPARFALGTELYSEGRFDEAIVQLRQLTVELPAHPSAGLARQVIGRAFGAQGKLHEASAEFQRMVDEHPADTGAHGFLADTLFAERRFAEAIPHYRILLAAHPEIPSAWSNLGLSLASIGRLDEAIDAFRRFAALDPQSSVAERHLAQAYLQQHDTRQAETHARDAIRLAPADPIAHSLLADALADQGDLDGAIDQFRQALQARPDDPNARNGLARALAEKNGRNRR